MIHPPKTDDHTIRGKVALKVKSKKYFQLWVYLTTIQSGGEELWERRTRNPVQ